MKIVRAHLDPEGIVRLLARDSRLELETWVYACTNGNYWIFEKNRNTALRFAAGEPMELRGRRIYHDEWELTEE